MTSVVSPLDRAATRSVPIGDDRRGAARELLPHAIT
jgi:hypothetical protein